MKRLFNLSILFLLTGILIDSGAVQAGFAGPVKTRPSIVGGSEIPANHPIAQTTVALIMDNSLCTGSIVDRDMVITAAHCLYGYQGQVAVVFASSLQDAPRSAVMMADRFVIHPSYDPSKTSADQNDLALVRLPSPLPGDYRPAELMPDGATLENGQSVILAGFGITDVATHAGAGVLRAAEVTVKNARLGGTEAVLDQTQGSGACHGDSGGPAFVEEGGGFLLWGVTSRGYPNSAADDCAHDVVYTKIGEQMGFVNEAARALRQ